MLDWFLNVAYADDAAGGGPVALLQLLPMILIFVVMYLILILPQKKKEKKAREMINAAQVGEKVVTISGIAGKIINIKDDEFTIETSVERTKINVKKWAVKEVVKPVEA